MTRKLTLNRDVLRELTDDELGSLVGAGPTSFSCLDYVSCGIVECLLEPSGR